MVRLKISPIFSIFFFIRAPCSWPKTFSHIHLSSWIFRLQSPVQTPRWRCAVQPRLQPQKSKSNETSSRFSPRAFRILSRIDFIFWLQYICGNLLLFRLPRPIYVVSEQFLLTQDDISSMYSVFLLLFYWELPPLEVNALTTSRRSHHTVYAALPSVWKDVIFYSKQSNKTDRVNFYWASFITYVSPGCPSAT